LFSSIDPAGCQKFLGSQDSNNSSVSVRSGSVPRRRGSEKDSRCGPVSPWRDKQQGSILIIGVGGNIKSAPRIRSFFNASKISALFMLWEETLLKLPVSQITI